MYCTCVASLGNVVSSVRTKDECCRDLNSLVLVLLQDLISVVLNATLHLIHEIRGLRLKEPAERDNAFSDSAEVVEQRRRSVRFSEVVDGIRSLVKLGHQLWRMRLRLLRFRGYIDIGALRLESLQHCF